MTGPSVEIQLRRAKLRFTFKFSIGVLVFSFSTIFASTASANGSDSREAIHQKILTGEPVNLPQVGPDDERTIEAAWIKEAVARNVKITIVGGVVRGDLDLQYATVGQEFVLENSSIADNADFSYSDFKYGVRLRQTTFHHGLSLRGAVFEQSVSLNAADIEGNSADFQDLTVKGVIFAINASFGSGADFGSARFERRAILNQTTFKEAVSFVGVRFGEDVEFRSAHFEQAAVFRHSHFSGTAAFGVTSQLTANFDGLADFSDAQFDGGAYFDFVVFHGDAEFSRSRFLSVATFRKVTFGAGSDFWGAEASEDLFLNGSVFTGTANFMTVKARHAVFGGDKVWKAAVFHSDADFAFASVNGLAIFTGVVFEKKARFTGMTVQRDLRFDKATVSGDAEFIEILVGGDASFAETAFKGGANFNHSQFKGGALFHSSSEIVAGATKFKGRTNFAASHFSLNVELDGVEFSAPLIFEHAEIDGRATFTSIRFMPGSNPSFKGTVFRQEAWFQHAVFKDDIDFRATRFGSEANFNDAKFEKSADFGGARFQGVAYFNQSAQTEAGALFHSVSFDHAQFESDADFSNTIFAGTVSFRDTGFRSVYFSPSGKVRGVEQFSADVDLRGCTYERIQAKWDSLLSDTDKGSRIQPYDRQPFVVLESFLRKVGDDEQANSVYLRRRAIEHSQLHGALRFWDTLYRWIANYGNDLRQEVFIAFILLFTGVFVFSRLGAVEPTDRTSFLPARISLWTAFWLSAHQFLPLGLPVKPPWSPTRQRVLLISAASYANFLQLLGWILVPLGIAALSGVLRHAAP